MFWRIAVHSIFPLFKVPRAIVQFRLCRLHRRLNQWFSKYLCVFVAFILSFHVSQHMGFSYEEQHWLIFLLRALAESYVTTWIINEMVDSHYYISVGARWRLPRFMLKYLFVWSSAQFRHPELADVISIFVLLWVVILLLEIECDDWRSSWHMDDTPPEIKSATEYWSLVSLLPSSNNGYLSRQFCPVKLCDPNRLDDPFWPDQVSTVFMVEVRRRNMLWRQLIIWQVSLLNGGKKEVHVFNIIDQWTDGQRFSPRWPNTNMIKCFESNGVIFIRDGHWSSRGLMVFDTRHGKSATYTGTSINFGLTTVSVHCKRRIFDSDDSVRGWQVRYVSHFRTCCECHIPQFGLRQCLRKSEYDLFKKATLIREEDVVFGSCSNWWNRRSRLIRNSLGSFGIYLEHPSEQGGPSVLYHPINDQFTYFPNFDALLQSDRPLALYNYTPSPIGGEYGDLCPTVLTSRECVESYQDGKVFRTEFKISSVKYITAKTVFRSRPNLRSEMSAEEFRHATGIDEMESHFDK